MGTISSGRAYYGLQAVGTPAGTNVSGSQSIGVESSSDTLTDADIAYSFQVTTTGVADVATLTLTSGSVAQTTGTPTIADGDGNDFEGATLATAVSIRAILIEAVSIPDTSTNSITFSAAALPDISGMVTGSKYLVIHDTTATGTMAITNSLTGAIIRVTVIAEA